MRTDLLTTIQNLKKKIADTKKHADDQVAELTKKLQGYTQKLADKIASGEIKIEDIEFKNHTEPKPPKKERKRRQPKKPQTSSPAGNPAPQQAANKQSNNNSMQSQVAEEEQKFEENSGQQEVMYRCLNPACKSKSKPIPASEIKKWDDTSGKKEPQCPHCLKWDVIIDEG